MDKNVSSQTRAWRHKLARAAPYCLLRSMLMTWCKESRHSKSAIAAGSTNMDEYSPNPGIFVAWRREGVTIWGLLPDSRRSGNLYLTRLEAVGKFYS